MSALSRGHRGPILFNHEIAAEIVTFFTPANGAALFVRPARG
jgi:hypothetical protein